MVYDADVLDMAEDIPVKMIKIPKEGYWMEIEPIDVKGESNAA